MPSTTVIALTIILPIALTSTALAPAIPHQVLQLEAGRVKPPSGVWISSHICAHNKHRGIKFYQVAFNPKNTVKLSVFYVNGEPQLFTGTTKPGSNEIYIKEYAEYSPFTYTITGNILKLHDPNTNDEFLFSKNPTKIIRDNLSIINFINTNNTLKLFHSCDNEFKENYTSQFLTFGENGTISITYYEHNNTCETVTGKYKLEANRLYIFTDKISESKEVFINGDHLVLRDIDSGFEFHYAIDSKTKSKNPERLP